MVLHLSGHFLIIPLGMIDTISTGSFLFRVQIQYHMYSTVHYFRLCCDNCVEIGQRLSDQPLHSGQIIPLYRKKTEAYVTWTGAWGGSGSRRKAP
jgi:late competence protein required for DNA uptake (superfamily II DNA/RNA helicase)